VPAARQKVAARMIPVRLALPVLLVLPPAFGAAPAPAESLAHRNTYAQAYGAT